MNVTHCDICGKHITGFTNEVLGLEPLQKMQLCTPCFKLVNDYVLTVTKRYFFKDKDSPAHKFRRMK